jgi:hypothetical protein
MAGPGQRLLDALESGLPISGGSVSGNITPAADDTYNLGSSALRWSELHVSDTIFSGATGAGWALIKVGTTDIGFRNWANSAYVTAFGATFYGQSTTTGVATLGTGHMTNGSSGQFSWTDSAVGGISGSKDTGLKRVAASFIAPTNGSTGNGDFTAPNSALTAGTMLYARSSIIRTVWHAFTWTNAQVVALGASLTGNISVCTLPAKTVVTNAYLVIGTAETALTSLNISVGRTGAGYIDYIVASNGKAAANTVYGDASAERGTNLTGYDLPSFTGTTTVYAQFVSGVENLSAALACTGTIYLETALLPV